MFKIAESGNRMYRLTGEDNELIEVWPEDKTERFTARFEWKELVLMKPFSELNDKILNDFLARPSLHDDLRLYCRAVCIPSRMPASIEDCVKTISTFLKTPKWQLDQVSLPTVERVGIFRLCLENGKMLKAWA